MRVRKILVSRNSGLILLLYIDMKSVEEAATMTGVALVDLTVVETAAGLTNPMKMTGQNLFPQVNAWNSKYWDGVNSRDRGLVDFSNK